MSTDINESLKLKLLYATKRKLYKEIDVYKLRNIERSCNDELAVIRTDIYFLKQQLETVKEKLTQYKYRISMIDICKTSELTKVEMQIKNINCYTKGFDDLFAKESKMLEIYKKEISDKEAVEQEVERQKEMEVTIANEKRAREVAAIEDECEAIERECIVLKKRNNAIMLKLRRKLLETENTRRELTKKRG